MAGRVLALPLVHVMALENWVEMQLDALVPVWLHAVVAHVATVPLQVDEVWQWANVS